MPHVNTDFVNRLCKPIWAITQNALEDWVAMAQTEKFNEAHLSGSLSEQFDAIRTRNDEYTLVDGGVAVVRVRGALIKEPDYYSVIFGESTYEGIRDIVQAALDDPRVRAIVLDVDSPGGTVDGVFELRNFLRAAGRIKPIYSYANGQMTSAAYLISGDAKEIGASIATVMGSIGVISMHADFSEFYKEMGIKITYLTAGKYKATGNAYEPLSSDARAYIQERLDHLYSLFVDVVAEGRGMSVEQVLKMADGKIFLAKQAVELGMIDRIETDLSAFISHIIEKEEIVMNLDQLKKDHPEVYAAAKADGAAEVKAECDAKTTAMQEQTAKLQQDNAALQGEVKELKRKDAIREEHERQTAMKAAADGIFAGCLAKSAVPVHLHGKIKAYLDPAKFCDEATGEFNVESFKTAVVKEIAEWSVTDGVTGSVAGGGYTGRQEEAGGNAGDAEAEEDALVSSLLTLVKPRKQVA